MNAKYDFFAEHQTVFFLYYLTGLMVSFGYFYTSAVIVAVIPIACILSSVVKRFCTKTIWFPTYVLSQTILCIAWGWFIYDQDNRKYAWVYVGISFVVFLWAQQKMKKEEETRLNKTSTSDTEHSLSEQNLDILENGGKYLVNNKEFLNYSEAKEYAKFIKTYKQINSFQ